jgi:hypothetical protein
MKLAKALLPVALLFSAADALAFHPRECWKTYVASHTFGPYEYKYSSWDWISSKTSTDEGFSKVSSMSSTQNTKMSVDPGITTTGASASHTEFFSSKGNCSVWAELHLRREALIAANLPALKRELAYGDGELARSLLRLSGCEPLLQERALARLQRGYATLDAADNVVTSFAGAVDEVLDGDAQLRDSCLSVST